MYSNRIIRSIAAGLMLLLFALSITPKQWLHDVITGHRHNYTKFEGKENYQASKNSFQCTWHNQAIESPFTHQPDFQVDHPVITHSSYFSYYTLPVYSAGIFFFSLRGPPSRGNS